MSTEKSTNTEFANFTNRNSLLKSRREFLVKSSVGVAGLALASSPIVKASVTPVALGNGFWQFLGKFAVNVGFNLASLYIYDYLKSRFGNQSYPVEQYNETQNRGYRHEADWKFYAQNYNYRGSNDVNDYKIGNRRILRAGFQRGQSAYPAYPYVFYPWVNSKDNLNGVTQFQNFGPRFSTCLAAPTIVGLSQASDEMLSLGVDVRPALLPHCQKRVSNGIYQRNYPQPDRYCSEDGEVTVDYQATGRGTGEVEVIYKGKPQVGKIASFSNVYGVRYA